MLGTLSQDEILELLARHFIGRIGCTDGDDVYIVPVHYIFGGDHVLCHSLDGQKIEMMRGNPSVCLQVDEIRDLKNWKSVVVNGIYEELYDEDAIADAAKKFPSHHLHTKASLSSSPPESIDDRDRASKPLSTPEVYYRIRFSRFSGRFEQEV